jgi:hypothetical protein
LRYLVFLPDVSARRKTYSVVDDFMASKDGLMIARAFARIASADLRHNITQFIDAISRGKQQLRTVD